MALDRWQSWWSFNRDPYFDLQRRLRARTTSSSADGRSGRAETQEAVLLPLRGVLQRGGDPGLLRQALLGLARISDERAVRGLARLDGHVQHFLTSSRPEIQEAAILALGIRGEPSSADLLLALLRDDARGRTALGAEAVPTRCRAFAAYALGLIGAESDSEDLRRRIAHALLATMSQDVMVQRELRVACTLGSSLVPIAPCRDAEQSQSPSMQMEDEIHLCGGVQTEYLLKMLRDTELDPWVRGHAAAALGRLAPTAGPGLPRSGDHPPILTTRGLAEALLEALDEEAEDSAVAHGCIIGLGLLVSSVDDDTCTAIAKRLGEEIKKGRPIAQRLSLISLGSSFGRPRDEALDGETLGLLMRELTRARGGKRPWAALALAVAGFRRMEHGEAVSPAVLQALRLSLQRAKSGEEAAAHTLALTVLRDESESTHDTILRRLKRLTHPEFHAHASLALGMVPSPEAEEWLTESFGGGEGPLETVIPAAIGLRLIGNTEVTPSLLGRLDAPAPPRPEGATSKKKANDSPGTDRTTERIVIVRTLALLDAREATERLSEIASDATEPAELRTASVWALAELADEDALDWSASFANDLNYLYLTWTLQSPFGDGFGLLDWR